MSSKRPLANREVAAFGTTDELHALIDTIPDAMVVIDADGRIVSFSKGAEEMFGYAEDEVFEENVSLLMPSPDRERHDSYIKHHLETGEERIIGIGRVTTARRRDGSSFPVELSVGKLKLGESQAFVGFIRDLTDSEKSRQLLHSLQSELAQVSRISSMGSLAASIAHELNQPLTAMTNYAQAARDLLADPGKEDFTLVREALNEGVSEALRARDIVQRLREFLARGDAQFEAASVRSLVRDAVALALVNGDGRAVDVSVDIDPTCDQVLVEPLQIQQVLMNLLRNALEAMEHCSTGILRITSKPAPKGMVQISVADSGPGIASDIADKIFHPFVSSRPSGMGLGLAICHSIIVYHGGKIWVERSEYGGTQFNFTVSRAETGEMM